jgi:membrane protein YqaA with SNARE-associated domain
MSTQHSEFVDFFLQNGPIYGSFVISFLSGLIPILNIELYLIVLALTGKFNDQFVLISFLAALGQIISKIIVYEGSRKSTNIRLGKKIDMEKVKIWSEKMMQNTLRADLIMFSSATVGIPPILITPFIAGFARYPLLRFVIVALVGRWIRFWACLASPALFQK